MVIILKQR